MTFHRTIDSLEGLIRRVRGSSIGFITQLDDSGILTGHILKAAEKGRNGRSVVLSEKGADLHEVLRKLHVQSAKEVNAHIIQHGIGSTRAITPTDDGDYDSDDDDEDDHRSDASETEDEGLNGHKAANLDWRKDMAAAGTTPVRLSPGSDSQHSAMRVPTAHTSYTVNGDGRAVHGCIHQHQPPLYRPVQAPHHGTQPSAWGAPLGSNGARNKPHQPDTGVMSVPPPPPQQPPGLAGPGAIRYGPLQPMPGTDTRRSAPPSAPNSTSGNGTPAVINVNWPGRCKFTFVDTVPLWRTPIIDAALRAAQARSESRPEPRLVGTLKRVRMGSVESDVRCLIDDLGPLLTSVAGTTGTTGGVVPSFDVELRSGPPH